MVILNMDLLTALSGVVAEWPPVYRVEARVTIPNFGEFSGDAVKDSDGRWAIRPTGAETQWYGTEASAGRAAVDAACALRRLAGDDWSVSTRVLGEKDDD